MLLDFDGSLSLIAMRPDLARPVEGAREVLAALVRRYRVVAIVTGRPWEQIEGLLAVPGLRYLGLYGIEGPPLERAVDLLRSAQAAATVVPEAWVEDKGVSVAVHYRQAPDPALARARLVPPLREVATSAGLELVEGKMVVELVPEDRPRKGGAVERLAAEHDLSAALFAGDDLADIEAFAALDRLAGTGILAVRVAVRGAETPEALVEAADVTVEGPQGLVELLRQLV